MATVDLDIINLALIKLDVSPLANLDGKAKAVQYANTTFKSLRDDVMGNAPWNFAMKRASLVRSTEDLVWGAESQAQYVLPLDNLRVWRVHQQKRWNVEGGFLILGSLNDEDNDQLVSFGFGTSRSLAPAVVNIRYIARIEEPQSYSAFFIETLATRLAFEWCVGLTGSDTKKEVLKNEWVGKQENAKALDGQEGVPEDIYVDHWNLSRID